jgi:predicted hydrocarbon binding protein
MGRILVASLHQAIADVRPDRLTFYENWLSSEGLRGGTIGVGSVLAVLSFLRSEGDAYHLIATRAGEYAGEWTFQTLSSSKRVFTASAPEWLRQRLVLRLARELVRSSHPDSRALSTLRENGAEIIVKGSIFCTVREPVAHPLCDFYTAALTRLFQLFDLPGRTDVVSCRATGGATCVLKVTFAEPAEETEEAVTAPAPEAGRRWLA